MNDWQPIETAPTDGRWLMLFVPDEIPEQVVGYWGWTDLPKDHEDFWEGWLYADEILSNHVPEGPAPTHWMPLPEPPEAA
jgi:hypothetical protein